MIQVIVPQHTEEVQQLLELLFQGIDVVGLGEISIDVGAQKP